MKKIAFILPSLKNVGPNKVAHAIINRIRTDDFYIKVYYFKNLVELEFPCDSEQLTSKNIKDLYSFDIIHSHMLRADILAACLPFYNGLKISTIHNMVEEDVFYSHGKLASKIISKIWVLAWKRFHKVAVLTSFAKEYYCKLGLKHEMLTVIANGINKKEPTTISANDLELINNFRNNKKLIGTVCLANERKGLEQIIKVLAVLQDHCFILIGDGPVTLALTELAEKLQVSERFLVFGFKENAISFLNLFDCFALPSRSEGLSLALIEAISMKVPVVCSDIDVITSAFESDEVSFFELDNIESLKNAIVDSCNNDIEKAYAHYLLEYNSDVMAEKYMSIYKGAVVK